MLASSDREIECAAEDRAVLVDCRGGKLLLFQFIEERLDVIRADFPRLAPAKPLADLGQVVLEPAPGLSSMLLPPVL